MTRTFATLISLALALVAATLSSANAQTEAHVALSMPAMSNSDSAESGKVQAEAHTALSMPASSSMASIEGGKVQLLFPIEGEEEIPVAPFRIDVYPVTNAQFLDFVTANPLWARSAVPEVFAAKGYLNGWQSDYSIGFLNPNSPVTNVSWFAAAAYCEARGDRLPTEAEWEFVGKGGFTTPFGPDEADFNSRILALTANRSQNPVAVGQGTPNYYGVHDMHGLVWEWVFDIGSGMATNDSRSEGDRRLQLVCGGGSSGAADKEDYGGFLRYAFRNGLEGNYSSGSLGFRCAGGAL